MLKVSLRDILEHNVLTFKVVPKDLESFYFDSAAESDIPLQVYLYGRCNALSWYLRIPSASNLDFAAESGELSQASLRGVCSALRWYLEIQSAFTLSLSLRVSLRRRRISVAIALL
jgi:hypothetical protein